MDKLRNYFSALKSVFAVYTTSWVMLTAAVLFWLVVPGATAILGGYAAARVAQQSH